MKARKDFVFCPCRASNRTSVSPWDGFEAIT